MEIPLTISGLYFDIAEEYPGVQISYRNKCNEILTTFETVNAVQSGSLSGVAISAKYYLKSPDLLSDFEAEIRGKDLPASYKVSTTRLRIRESWGLWRV